MGESVERCAVCEGDGVGQAMSGEAAGAESASFSGPQTRTRMARVVIQGRSLCLCRAHAATVAVAMPKTFEEMRALFVGIARSATAAGGHAPTVERRSPIPRRDAEDRRAFPPRPEGRRLGGGRRATDPRD